MIDEQKLYSIWIYLQAEPLFWLTLTIGSYLIADFIYRKSNLFPLLNPVAISVLLVSLILIFLIFNMSVILKAPNLFIFF